MKGWYKPLSRATGRWHFFIEERNGKLRVISLCHAFVISGLDAPLKLESEAPEGEPRCKLCVAVLEVEAPR